MKDIQFAARAFKHPEIWYQAFKLAKVLAMLLAGSMLLNIALGALAFALAGRPADVVVVDQLGQTTFIPAVAAQTPPQSFEAEAFARHWGEKFLSLDAVTASDDLAEALTVAHPDLQQKLRSQLIESGVLDKIRDAFVRSVVRFEKVSLGKNADDRFEVTLEGARTLTAMGAEHRSVSEPVKLELVLARVPRTKITPNGLIVRYVSGTFRSGANQ